jgi:hypothetical protein
LTVDVRGDDTASYQFVFYDVPPTVPQTIALDETATGSIDVPGAVDAWEIDIAADQTVFLDVQQIAGPDYPILDFELVAPDGTSIFASANVLGGQGDHGPAVLDVAGTYTLTVDVRGDDTASYQFVFYDVPPTIPQAIVLDETA